MHHKSVSAPQTRGRVIHWARFYDLISLLMCSSVRRKTVEMAQLVPGEKVLDVGCGTGTLAIAAKSKVGPRGGVHGIDASPEMIEVAQRKAAKERVDVRFQVALIEELPFPDSQFDLVLSSLMLHHLPDDLKQKGFAEIKRVLKPGGRLFAVDLGAKDRSLLGRILGFIPGHHHRLPPDYLDQLKVMAQETGFSDVEAGPLGEGGLGFVSGVVGKVGEAS